MELNNDFDNKTPDDNDLLAGLEDPDSGCGEPTRSLDQNESIQLEFAARILKDSDVLRYAAAVLPAKAFTDNAHKVAVATAYDFYGKYGCIPTLAVLQQAITKTYAGHKALPYYVGAVNSLIDYVPETLPKQYVLDQLRDYAYATSHMRHVSKVINAMLEGKFSEVRDLEAKHRATLEKISSVGPPDYLKTWTETLATITDEEWLLTNWLDFGSLAMLSGNPFSGKSHIVSEVITGIVKHGTFARYKVPRCAVLLIDAENKPRVTVKRILRALDGDEIGELATLYRQVDATQLKLPLPLDTGPETIRQMIQTTKKDTGQDKIFVIVDTLRSVFAADEMENDQMKSLLYPLQRVAQEENAAVLILHHRPKSGAAYSGQTSIAGACDYLWMWESNIETRLGELSLVGTRGDHEPKLQFRLTDGRNCWIPDEDMQATEESIVQIVTNVLKDGEMKKGDLVKEVMLHLRGSHGVNKVRELVGSLEGSVLVSRSGINNAVVYSLLA